MAGVKEDVDGGTGAAVLVRQHGNQVLPHADGIHQDGRQLAQSGRGVHRAVVGGNVKDAVHLAFEECRHIRLAGFCACRPRGVDDHERVTSRPCSVIGTEDNPSGLRRGVDVLAHQPKDPAAPAAEGLRQPVGPVAELFSGRPDPAPRFSTDAGVGGISAEHGRQW